MLNLVKMGAKNIAPYKKFISPLLLKEIKEKSKGLKKIKVFMVNSTPRGGGVAEILNSLVPLMKGVGIEARWYTIPAEKDIFFITKKIHLSLQDKKYALSKKEWGKYIQYQKEIARSMAGMKPDIWIIHDPQPAGALSFFNYYGKAVLRIHIDTTEPNKDSWNFLSQFFPSYEKIIFSSKKYSKPGIREKSVFFTPAIDPLTKKNQKMPGKKAVKIISKVNPSIKKPLISQVSRFDVFKDPEDVIKAYKLARNKINNLKLILAGFFIALDDPDALEIFKKVEKMVKGEKNVFVFNDLKQLKGVKMEDFINAIQAYPDVIIQNSVREGFGLTVSEALWKENAVIGGPAEGIKLQIKNGYNGYIANNSEEMAKEIISLIENKEKAKKFGRRGKEIVREKFLIPRLLLDYLNLFENLF